MKHRYNNGFHDTQFDGRCSASRCLPFDPEAPQKVRLSPPVPVRLDGITRGESRKSIARADKPGSALQKLNLSIRLGGQAGTSFGSTVPSRREQCLYHPLAGHMMASLLASSVESARLLVPLSNLLILQNLDVMSQEVLLQDTRTMGGANRSHPQFSGGQVTFVQRVQGCIGLYILDAQPKQYFELE